MPPLTYNIESPNPAETRLPNYNASTIKPFDIQGMATLYNIAQHKRKTELDELKLTGDEIGDTNSILKDLKTLPKHNLLLQQKMVDNRLTLKDTEGIKTPEAAIAMHSRAQQLLMDPEVRNWIKENEYYKDVHIATINDPDQWMEKMGADKYKEYSDRVTAGLQPGGENLMDIVPGAMIDIEAYKLKLADKKALADQVLQKAKIGNQVDLVNLNNLKHDQEFAAKMEANTTTLINEISDPVDKAAAELYAGGRRYGKHDPEIEKETAAILQEYVNDKRNGTNKYKSIYEVEAAFEVIKKTYNTTRTSTSTNTYASNGGNTKAKLGTNSNIISTTVESSPGSVSLVPDKTGNYHFMLTDDSNINRNMTIDKNGKLSIDGGTTTDKGADLAFADGSYSKTFHTVRALDSKGHINNEYGKDFVDLAPLKIKYGYDGVVVDNGKMKGILTFNTDGKAAAAAAKAFGPEYKAIQDSKEMWRISKHNDPNGDVMEMDLAEVGKLKEKYMDQQATAINNARAGITFDPSNPMNTPPRVMPKNPPMPITPDTNSKEEAEKIVGVLSDTMKKGSEDGKPQYDTKAYIRKLRPEVLNALVNLNYGNIRTKGTVINNALPLVFTDINETDDHARGGNHPTGNAIDLRFGPNFTEDTKTNFAFLHNIQTINRNWAEQNNVDLYFEDKSVALAKDSLDKLAKAIGGNVVYNENSNAATMLYRDKVIQFKIRGVPAVSGAHIHMDIFPEPNKAVITKPTKKVDPIPDYTGQILPTLSEADQQYIKSDSLTIIESDPNADPTLSTKPTE